MAERPILFSGPMVRALLDGTKTQTRRVWKMPLGCQWYAEMGGESEGWVIDAGQPWWLHVAEFRCPYGQPGDRLWVREAWAETRLFQSPGAAMVVYREGDNRTDYGGPWKPSIHMRRRDSRILLEITDVRVERLRDCSEADAAAEGMTTDPAFPAYDAYAALWDQIHGKGAWAANPWVWAVSFKRLKQGPAHGITGAPNGSPE